jgi:UPF0716 protein FxsA
VPLLLVLLFIVVPIAELYVIIQVGQWIGLLPTLALLLADALLGALLLRQQGRSAWRRFNAAIAERRFPGREAADGVMVAVGGTLLLTPGFITDIFGFLLLVPPTRALVRRGLFRFLGGRFVLVGTAAGAARRGWGRGGGSETGPQAPGSAPAGSPYDLEGEASEVPADGEPEPRNPPRLPPS